MEVVQNKNPQIYVVDVAALDRGLKNGVWIDATLIPHQMMEQIQTMLAASPVPGATQWEVFDDEGFHDFSVRSNEDLAVISDVASLIAERGVLAAKLCAMFNRDVRYVRKVLNERYQGCYPSLGAYVRWIYEELGEAKQPDEEEESIGRAMEYNAEIFIVSTDIDEIHVFVGR